MTLSITIPYKECHYAECRGLFYCYAECECHHAECRCAECHHAECSYAECRGTTQTAGSPLSHANLLFWIL